MPQAIKSCQEASLPPEVCVHIVCWFLCQLQCSADSNGYNTWKVSPLLHSTHLQQMIHQLIGPWVIWIKPYTSNFSNLFQWLMPEVSLAKLASYACHSPHWWWFRLWLGAVRQQAIMWANVDPDPCQLMVSLGHNYCQVSNISRTFVGN